MGQQIGCGAFGPDFAVLCFAVLCFAVLCFAVLCFAVLCFAVLCFALLCFALLCFAVLCYALLCFALLAFWIRSPNSFLSIRVACLLPFATPSCLLVIVKKCLSRKEAPKREKKSRGGVNV